MKEDFQSYPEIIFIDVTYKLTELRLPVYIFLVEDSMGENEIAGVGLLMSENAESLRWLLSVFKGNNVNDQPRVIMADKDFKERYILKECFPTASVLICLFHTLRSFKRELSDKRFSLSESQNITLKELFQKMCYARNVTPAELRQYFLEHWHSIRSEWVLVDKCQAGNFLNTTNNHLESINSKLKSVIDFYSSQENFVKHFFNVLYVLRNERDNKAAISFQKTKVCYFSVSSPEEKYFKFLTNYAANFVINQIKRSRSVNNLKMISPHQFEINTSDFVLKFSLNVCGCNFYTSMKLPCQHIFAATKMSDIDLFDESLCDMRWTASYYHRRQRIFVNKLEAGPSKAPQLVVATKPKKILNQNEN